jgi:hypothetical protein
MKNRTLMSAALLASVFATSVLAGTAPVAAQSTSVNRDFCGAIGLEPGRQAACERDLENATNSQQVRDLQDRWVAESAVAQRFTGASLYDPPVDNNQLNGVPGTPYQSKPRYVSNQATAAIHRALRDDNLATGPSVTD